MKKFDLLKFRGKGRNLSAGKKRGGSRSNENVHPLRKRQEAMRKAARSKKRR